MSPYRCFILLLIIASTVPLSSAAGQGGRRGADEWAPRTSPFLWGNYSPDAGLVIGAGLAHARYGFRALPASTHLVARAAYATVARTYHADVAAEFRRPLAPATIALRVRASGLDVIRFYGFGNESDATGPDSAYRVRQRRFALAPTVSIPLAPRLRVAVGPLVSHGRTHADAGTVLATTGPHYGVGDFGQMGTSAALERDTRDAPVAAARGAYLRVAGRWYAPVWDVTEPFGTVSADAATYVSVGDPAAATVALRAGGEAVIGTAPFHHAVYLGGANTIRGYAEDRFAGRRGVYANAELRLRVARPAVGDVGMLGLADAGRVWVSGESSHRWHGAGGGGLWFAWRHRRANTVSLTVARSPERTALYVQAGFMF
jgi:outer membrane protein assembly factor BamA